MSLLPPEESELVRQLLWSENLWVQERACETLGRRDYQAAIADLVEVALHGKHNGRTAAIMALKRMRGAEAKQNLVRLREQLGKGFSAYFR